MRTIELRSSSKETTAMCVCYMLLLKIGSLYMEFKGFDWLGGHGI